MYEKYKISTSIYITNSKNNIFLKKIIHNPKNKLVSRQKYIFIVLPLTFFLCHSFIKI